MNWDIAIDVSKKCMGVGVIIRDHQGHVSAALSKNIQSVQDPGTVETLGALIAVEFSRDLRVQDIILEGDCLPVVKAIKESNLPWCIYGQVVGDTKIVLNTRRSWMVYHVRRAANFAALGLAKATLKISTYIVWMEEVPPCILEIFSLELSAL